MTEHKKAMVSPRTSSPPLAGSVERLALMLAQLGNDRPYTLIRKHGNKFKIIFAGDLEPVIVKYEGDQPVIVKPEGKGKSKF